jgi:hypothetical protein
MPDAAVMLDSVDRHWAVAAISAADRTLARQSADAAWTALHDEGVDGRRAQLKKPAAALIANLATAYDRAGIDRVEALRHAGLDPAPEGSGRADAELEAAAANAFALYRALPQPGGAEPVHLFEALRVAAVGVVGAAGRALSEWVTLVRPTLVLAPAAETPWDAMLAARLTAVWLDLLVEPGPESVERAFETLGWLREARAVGEAVLLVRLPTAEAQQMRLHLNTLYSLADAAVALTLHMRRGPLADTPARLVGAFDRARAVTASETALDGTLLWLYAAAQRVAARQTAQMMLPGLSA